MTTVFAKMLRGANVCPGARPLHYFRLICRWKFTHYDTLKVPMNASQKQIKAAFYELSKKYHPDLHHGDPTMNEKFVKINAAYAVLSNKVKKFDYDLTISKTKPQPPPSSSARQQQARSSSSDWQRSPPPPPGDFSSRARWSQGRSSSFHDGFDSWKRRQAEYYTSGATDNDTMYRRTYGRSRPNPEEERWINWNEFDPEYDRHAARRRAERQWRNAPREKSRSNAWSLTEIYVLIISGVTIFAALRIYLAVRTSKLYRRQYEMKEDENYDWYEDTMRKGLASHQPPRQRGMHYTDRARQANIEQSERDIRMEIEKARSRTEFAKV